MQQVVTITGLSTKTGSNDSGGWTLYLFETAGGTKFQTFDDDLGKTGSQNLNQAVEIEYEAEERKLPAKGDMPARTVTNNTIKAIRPATEEQAAQAATEAPTTNDRTKYQRSKEEVRYTSALQTAATLLASPHWDAKESPVNAATLFDLADVLDAKLAGI